MQVLPAAAGYLIDLDGTLMSGGWLLPDARQMLDAVRGHFAIISNDAEHTPRQLSQRLRRLDLAVPTDRIVMAGTATLDILAAERPGASIMLLGSRALCGYARRIGLRIGSDRADVVVLARDRSFTYARLGEAANAVRAGAALFVANPDLTHPGLGGRVVPETGALLRALLACTGPVPYRTVGKPEEALFRSGLALLGTAAAETVMIGDNPETDGEGARRLGLRYLQMQDGRLPGSRSPACREEPGARDVARVAGSAG